MTDPDVATEYTVGRVLSEYDLLDLQVYCQDCETGYTVAELLRQGGCNCE
jgi:hypothetical protein